MRELLLLAIILVCPLAMILMMRGGHGESGHTEGHRGGRGPGPGAPSGEPKSSAELRRELDDLDRLIESREAEEQGPSPAGDGWR